MKFDYEFGMPGQEHPAHPKQCGAFHALHVNLNAMNDRIGGTERWPQSIESNTENMFGSAARSDRGICHATDRGKLEKPDLRLLIQCERNDPKLIQAV